MALANRLYLLETVLNHDIKLNRRTPRKDANNIRPEFDGYFTRAWLQTREGDVMTLYGNPGTAFAFTDQESAHLNSGKTLIISRSRAGRFAEILMVKGLDLGTRSGPPPVLAAEMAPLFLWEREEIASSYSEVAVLNESGRVLYSSLPGLISLPELKSAMGLASAAGSISYKHGGEPYLARYRTVFISPTLFENWIVLVSEKKVDVFKPLQQFRRTFLLIGLLSIWVIIFLSVRQIRKSLVPIEQLKDATDRIAAKDFSIQVRIHTQDEFAELGDSFNKMTRRLADHVRTMETINDIGISLSAERDQEKLISIILGGARKLIHADGAALYLLGSGGQLNLALMCIDSLNLTCDSKSIALPGAQSDNPPATPILISSPLLERTNNIPDIYAAREFDLRGQISFDERMSYRTRSVLSVPLRDHLNSFIGVLQLSNALDQNSGLVVMFSEQDIRIAESLASQAAVTLTKNRLAEEFKRLFEGLTELVATAVDAKSRYTGDHCKRVHALTMMIAEAVNRADCGPFAGFSLSENEIYELKIAALLHDCGKVATPVHIMDKSTKLETITDRIQLVEARFQILKREKHIALLRNQLIRMAGDQSNVCLAGVDRDLRSSTEVLDADLEFLKRSNLGSEFMSESMRTYVRDIARKYYWPNEDGQRVAALTDDEVENLTIVKGTLTQAERTLMEQHAELTIKMLQALPYPENLRNIPSHAGSHHERMDGTGYPRGLNRDDISIQGRIIALADAFEAITAADRPYKKPNRLSEALAILHEMKSEGHIDPDIYDLFIAERVYLRYAEQFIPSSQMNTSEIRSASC
jgi:HD-GYP domain-containing protein (c-di-GMP phosphodiesterase class II)/HAMP domain-containing protein